MSNLFKPSMLTRLWLRLLIARRTKYELLLEKTNDKIKALLPTAWKVQYIIGGFDDEYYNSVEEAKEALLFQVFQVKEDADVYWEGQDTHYDLCIKNDLYNVYGRVLYTTVSEESVMG